MRETATAVPSVQTEQQEPIHEPKARKIVQNFNAKDIEGCHDYDAAIRAYLTGSKSFKNGRFEIKDDILWFKRKRNVPGAKRKPYLKDILAQKINGIIVGNSSVIIRGGRQAKRGRGQAQCQVSLRRYVPMVPFSVFKDSKLDIKQFELIDMGQEETLDLGRKHWKTGEKIMDHFTGAMLFRVEENYYLFDLDRNDVALKQFNAFMSRIPKPCATIDEAYASLKPQEVYDAERFMKEPCPRHGEWFFIPVPGEFTPDTAQMRRYGWGSNAPLEARLQSKGNRPHFVADICKEGFVRGRVRHGGLEHKDITLKGWHKPVPNTAVESYKISGEVD